MAKASSKILAILSRLIKGVMVAVVIPLAVGLYRGVVEQLDVPALSGSTFGDWIRTGFVVYVGSHILLYRPVGLFRVSHRLFSQLATWLFGGQVASVDAPGGGKGSGKGAKSGKADAASQGSTLVAFSPYVVPLYTILVCALGWVAGQWVDRTYVDGPVAFLIGVTIAFHWLMTADDLQQQREQWHVETYLLAIGLVFVLTLVIGGLCVPWAVPEFSFVRALAAGWANTHTMYITGFRQLFL